MLWRRSLLPTTALYFLNSYADMVTEKPRTGLVQQVGTNSFRTGSANLIVRYDLPEVVRVALSDRTRQLVYLIDDHVGAYVSDSGLPEKYRKRLAERWRNTFQPLLRRADAIVVCSDYLQHHLAGYASTFRADPVWDERLFAGLEQRIARPAAAGVVRVAYLGTNSHQEELAFLVPVLTGLLDARPDIELTLPAGTAWPASLNNHPRVILRWPVPWFEYEEKLAGERFDLCLYPCLNTPFASGRSLNKLTEHALTGAFGLFSDSWPHAQQVLASGAGAVVRNMVDSWIDAALEAIDGLDAWQSRAADVAAKVIALNDPAPQRALWEQLLGPMRVQG